MAAVTNSDRSRDGAQASVFLLTALGMELFSPTLLGGSQPCTMGPSRCQLVGWQHEGGGHLGRGVGRWNGEPAQSALAQRPPCQACVGPLTNGSWLSSLICGVLCNNKMLLKAGSWQE